MTMWEYSVRFLDSTDLSSLDLMRMKLNNEGTAGWELVTVLGLDGSGALVFLKRPVS